MFFALAPLAALVTLASAAAVKRGDPATCTAGAHGIGYLDFYGGAVLASACTTALGNSDHSGLWTQRSCVAAAVASYTPEVVWEYANCPTTATIPARASLSSLDYNVYASIVGDCAWAEGGCPITQQNFIDLVYSELAATGQNVYPSSAQDLITNRIAPIFTWTNFTVAEGVPYLNFNDFLHYAY